MSEKDLLIYVDCGDGAVMCIPRLNPDGGIEWRLRYGDPEVIRYVAATVAESYSYLVSNEISMTEAMRRLRLLRRARQTALSTPESP